jgi:hypothetical protein
MTTFPGSPKLLKGALVTIDPDAPQTKQVIEFQYNPETMTRRLEPRAMGGEGGDKVEVYRLTGVPRETITLSIEIDATDKLEKEDPQTLHEGIYPALAALEVLVYPTVESVIENEGLAQQGNIEIIPPEAPLTLLVWGPKRVLPVRITSFSITEEAYATNLCPIRAKVELSLQVLSYSDFLPDHDGYKRFRTHHQEKQNMAGQYVTGSMENLGVPL